VAGHALGIARVQATERRADGGIELPRISPLGDLRPRGCRWLTVRPCAAGSSGPVPLPTVVGRPPVAPITPLLLTGGTLSALSGGAPVLPLWAVTVGTLPLRTPVLPLGTLGAVALWPVTCGPPVLPLRTVTRRTPVVPLRAVALRPVTGGPPVLPLGTVTLRAVATGAVATGAVALRPVPLWTTLLPVAAATALPVGALAAVAGRSPLLPLRALPLGTTPLRTTLLPVSALGACAGGALGTITRAPSATVVTRRGCTAVTRLPAARSSVGTPTGSPSRPVLAG
jgi:hypothetical protein